MRLPLLVLLAGSLLAAGCGGDDDSASSSKPNPTSTATPAKTADAATEKEWASKVTSVCKQSQKRSLALVAKLQRQGLQGQELAAETLDRSVPLLRRMLGDLESVPAPAAIQDDYDAWVKRLSDSVPLFEQLGDTVKENKADPELETKLKDLAADTRPFAIEHGLKACLPDKS